MSRLRFASVLLALVAPSATLPDDAEALRELRIAFREVRRPEAVQGQRERALAGVAGLQTPAVAEALLDAAATVSEELAGPEERHREFVLRGHADGVQAARPGIDPLRELLAAVLARVRDLDDPAAARAALEHALGGRRLPLPARLAGARRAAALEGLADAKLLGALGRARKAPDLLVALVAAEGLGRSARPLAARVVDALEHADGIVREAAVDALVAMAAPEAIAPLVRRLEAERGRGRAKVMSALGVLTGERIQTADGWRRWLAEEGAAFVAGERELGKGAPLVASDLVAQQYHGVPLDGESIVFLLDTSLSMRKTLKRPAGIAADPADSRDARARSELARVLATLPASKRFEIVAFGGRLERFAEEPVAATPETIERALAWVAERELHFGTRIHDALELAFALAGAPPSPDYQDPRVDTIFLLTDGRPYVGRAPDDTEAILRAARRWNLLRRVRIHAIGLGDEVPVPFLEQLAADHGGEFVHELAD